MTVIEIHFIVEEDGSSAEEDVHESLSKVASERGEEYSIGMYLSSTWNSMSWGELKAARLNGFDDASHPEQIAVPDLPHVTLRVQTDQYEGFGKDHYDTDEQLENLYELVHLIYETLSDQLRIAYGLSFSHRDAIGTNRLSPPVTGESIAENRIEFMSWLVIFPPAFVETYGKETLLSAPAWRVEELQDGSVLLVAFRNPLETGKTKPIDDHLGLESPDVKDMFY